MATITFIDSNSPTFTHLRAANPIKYCSPHCPHKLQMVAPKTLDQFSQLKSEAVVIANCPKEGVIERVEQLKKNSKIIWQIDDYFWGVPETNPHYQPLTQAIPRLNSALELADEIWTTTQQLASHLPPEKTKVLPNLLDNADYEKRPRDHGVCWIGGSTHWADLLLIEDLEGPITFFGDIPEKMREYAIIPHQQRLLIKPNREDITYHRATIDLKKYFDTLKTIEATVGLAPLQDNEFNRCKSPLKIQEYSMMGMVTVASNIPPYSLHIRHGYNGLLVNEGEDWAEVIAQATPEIAERAWFNCQPWTWQGQLSSLWIETLIACL